MDERIENYLEQKLSTSEREQFEADLKSDSGLAEAFAMYVSAKTASGQLKNGKDEQFRDENRPGENQRLQFRQLRVWFAAAAVLAFAAFGLAWYFVTPAREDLQQTATAYSEANFLRLNAETNAAGDSAQLAAAKYNDGQYATATKICEEILLRDPQNTEAKRIAGIVALRLLDYDKAIMYFHQLSDQKDRKPNPGKFYEAIALLQSGLPANKKKGEILLQEVIDGELEGKQEATRWLE
jgi:tetratricopeptide (TPR) repeat protein